MSTSLNPGISRIECIHILAPGEWRFLMPDAAKASQYIQSPCLCCYPWDLCSEGQGVKGFPGGVKLVIFMSGDKEIEIMDRRLTRKFTDNHQK